jgi:hypothetical protein
MEEVSQLRKIMSQSIAGNNNSMLNLEHADSVGESASWDEEEYLFHVEECIDRELKEAAAQFEIMKSKAALLHKKKGATLIPNREATQHRMREAEIHEDKRRETELRKEKDAEELQKKEAEQLQKKKEQVLLQKKKKQGQMQKKLQAAITQKNHQVLFILLFQFSEFLFECIVLLLSSYSCLVSYFISARKRCDTVQYNEGPQYPVAKGTILSTDWKKIVAGRELGTECCVVVINYIIMKRDTILPRPVGKVTTIAQAQGRSIAWLYKHVCLCFFSSFFCNNS